MRILYIHHLSRGDTAMNHVRQFADAVSSLGHSLKEQALGDPEDPTVGTDEQKYPRQRPRLLSYLLHEPKELVLNAVNWKRVLSEASSYRPDVVLLRSDFFAFSPLLASRKLRLPTVLEINAPASESTTYLDQYLHLPLAAHSIERWKLRKADRVVTVSSALRDYLVDLHSVPVTKFTNAPNGADLARFRPDNPPDNEIARLLGDGLVVGFVGAFKQWHGSELMKEMILRISSMRPETGFLMVGDGPGRTALERGVRARADRVVFTGGVSHDRIPSLTARIDVAVLPETAFYCSPLKVIEWMAAGRAIVAPDYQPLCEVIDSGRQGLLFPRGRVDELVGAVIRLLDNPDLRERLGESARRRAEKTLSWQHNADLVIGACKQAIADHSPKQARD